MDAHERAAQSNESDTRGPYTRVLAALVERHPYGHTARSLGAAADVHGRQLGGALRSFRSSGVIERSGSYIWITEPARTVWELDR